MKIWYLSAYDQPYGQSTRTHDFSRELVRRGHEVTFFTNGYCHFKHTERLSKDEKWRVEEIDGIRVVWIKTRPYVGNGIDRGLNMLDNVTGILSVYKKIGNMPDVVLGPSVPIMTGWAAARIATSFGVPFVYEVRDVWPDALVDMGGMSRSSLTYKLFRHVEKNLYRQAASISSTLPCLQSHVEGSGADPGKVVCIPNGIDLSIYNNAGPYHGGDSDRLTVMYVGGFGLDHDVPTIIKAAKLLQDSGDERFRFVIYGGGVRKPECVEQARSYGLKNLEIHNPVSKSLLPEIQAQADILVAAITDSKSYRFGLNLNKLCAYFASARPVLFSGNPPNNPVRDANAGLTVDAEKPSEMVLALTALADMGANERADMGRRGRAYAENVIAMNVLGDKMESLLKTVAGSR